jgi:hypothetical protein
MSSLEARVARLERWWIVSLAAALGVGVWAGSRTSTADAPVKDITLADGSNQMELHPWGVRITTGSGEADLTATELAVGSTASKRKVQLRVDDKNAVSTVTVSSGGDRSANLVVGPYTELELVGDQSSVDLRAADEARVAARTDPFTYAEVSAKGTQPCWTLGVKTGTAMRSCNDKK